MDIADALRPIGTSADFRMLRRVPAVADWKLPTARGETRRGVGYRPDERDFLRASSTTAPN